MTEHQRFAHQEATRRASLYPDGATRRWVYRKWYAWALGYLAREEARGKAWQAETRELFRDEGENFSTSEEETRI